MSPNGHLLSAIIEKYGLIVANGLESKCEGSITRKRITSVGTEQSIIDLSIFTPDLIEYMQYIKIDEHKKFSLTKITKNNLRKESDHNATIVEMNFEWDQIERTQNKETYNIRNKKGLRHLKNTPPIQQCYLLFLKEMRILTY